MSEITRRDFLGAVAGGAAALALPGIARALADVTSGNRPNIVIVLSDDLGYGDLARFGSEIIKTPHLDAFADDGVKFTDCYAAAAVCSPARAGLLTGRTPNRCGIYTICSFRSAPMHLPKKEVTVARLLRDAGYQTCIVGKWHLNSTLGAPSEPTPGDHGFDHWFVTENNAKPSHHNPDNFVRNGKPVGRIEGWSSEIIVDEAADWLAKRDASKPFFLFVSLHSPHDPIATPPDMIAKYPDAPKLEAEYYGNVTHLDREFGRLMKALDDMKLRDDTFVMFTSDNGPQVRNGYRGTQNCFGSAGPLRAKKSWLYEGGIRVPGMIRWPGKIKPGRVSGEPVSGVDILPTLCAIAGFKAPADRKIDGANILPACKGEVVRRASPLFWAYYRRPLGQPFRNVVDVPKVVIREGDWKLCAYLNRPKRPPTFFMRGQDMDYLATSKPVKYELYNVRSDVGETKDLSTDQPGRVKEMASRLSAMLKDVQAEGPKWKFSK